MGVVARSEGRYEEWGDEWDWDARCEIHKESIKNFRKYLQLPNMAVITCVTSPLTRLRQENQKFEGVCMTVCINACVSVVWWCVNFFVTYVDLSLFV